MIDAATGIGQMEHRAMSGAPVSVYREYAPRAELREHVRALFWFGPAMEHERHRRRAVRELSFWRDDSTLAPVFADGHSSLVFELGWHFRGDGTWNPSSSANATAMGAITHATLAPSIDRPAMIGVYLRPRACAELLGVKAAELTDQIIPLSEIWKRWDVGPHTSLESVETLLMRRLKVAPASDACARVGALASHVQSEGGRVSVARMSELTGLSRQHLGRLFREYVGVSPKLYARLARFRATLRHVTARGSSGLAAQLGYSDQSHMIAEFREFSSLTPEQLARGERFHPFVGDDA
jgi:AraC-like DNA-binding protein